MKLETFPDLMSQPHQLIMARTGDSAGQLRTVKSQAESIPIQLTQVITQQGTEKSRIIRSKYLALMNKIDGTTDILASPIYISDLSIVNLYFFTEKRDDLERPDSETFNVILSEMEKLHREGNYLFCFV